MLLKKVKHGAACKLVTNDNCKVSSEHVVNCSLLGTESSRQDVKVLQSTIHRLNQELSRYQRQFRKLDDSEVRCHVMNSDHLKYNGSVTLVCHHQPDIF